jgi:hypothetical protein
MLVNTSAAAYVAIVLGSGFWFIAAAPLRCCARGPRAVRIGLSDGVRGCVHFLYAIAYIRVKGAARADV